MQMPPAAISSLPSLLLPLPSLPVPPAREPLGRYVPRGDQLQVAVGPASARLPLGLEQPGRQRSLIPLRVDALLLLAHSREALSSLQQTLCASPQSARKPVPLPRHRLELQAARP